LLIFSTGKIPMILWSIQSPEAWSALQDTGVLRARREHVPDDDIYRPSYEWMVDQMTARIGPPPEVGCMPIWAWHTHSGGRGRKPDLRRSDVACPGVRAVRLEIECPDDAVLLSSYGDWHRVLNFTYCAAVFAEREAFEAAHPPGHPDYERLVTASWERIFGEVLDLAFTRGWCIQATMWEIRRDQVRKSKEFVGRNSRF